MSETNNSKTVNEKSTLRVKGDAGKGASKPHREPKASPNGFRWTVIDWVILLWVVLSVTGVILRGVLDSRKDSNSPVAGPYYVNFTIESIHATVLGEIDKMAPLYVYETGEQIGYIGVYEDSSIALHSIDSVNVGNASEVSAEGCMICLEGVYRNGSLLVSGMSTYLAPGTVLNLRTDKATFTVEITDIWIGE